MTDMRLLLWHRIIPDGLLSFRKTPIIRRKRTGGMILMMCLMSSASVGGRDIISHRRLIPAVIGGW